MLIRFKVSNFRSFDGETEFNMLASSDQRTFKEHTYRHQHVELLKAAAIYGANGAGKSNLIRAIEILSRLVESSGKEAFADLHPYKLGDSADEPTAFEIEFIRQGVAYVYGLTASQRGVAEEYLYQSGLGKREDALLFHRTGRGGELELKFANEYTADEEGRFRLKFYQNEYLKDDSLLLTELADLKEGFGDVKQARTWFRENLLIVFPHMPLRSLIALLKVDKQFSAFLADTLRSFRTGVAEVGVITSTIKDFSRDQPALMELSTIDGITRMLKNGQQFVPFSISGEESIAVLENDQVMVKQLFTRHEATNGKLIDFSTLDESDGTNRLLDYLPAFYQALTTASTVLIDEIDQSIHPALLKELVRKFMANNSTKGQLIFTTHESNLLDQHIFRRDEIWFAEKHQGATQLYPLSDFDIRKDLDISKGYLNGRFGAIPFTGNLTDLNWAQYAEV